MSILDVFAKDKGLGNLLDTSAKTAPDKVSPAANTLNLETSASANAIKERTKGKRAKPESGGKPFSFEDSRTAALDAANAEVLAAVFDPEVWKDVVAAPGEFGHMVTGKEHWLISENEKRTLAATGSATFRAFAIVDPKWVALALFSASVLTIYGGRFMKDAIDNKKKQKPANAAPPATVQ